MLPTSKWASLRSPARTVGASAQRAGSGPPAVHADRGRAAGEVAQTWRYRARCGGGGTCGQPCRRGPVDRASTGKRKLERDMAVVFMVDMGGPTRGCINHAERESLVLLCGALEPPGDRYAMFAFFGMTHECREICRGKGLHEGHNRGAQRGIAGLNPRDDSRMGLPGRVRYREHAQGTCRGQAPGKPAVSRHRPQVCGAVHHVVEGHVRRLSAEVPDVGRR